jgi:hypothetical protein
MADIHVADFNRDCAAILVALYRGFPRKTNIYVDDIAGPDEPDEFGLPSPRHQACFGTLLWLAEAGYIQYETTIRQEALDQASLTHMGYVLLESRVDASAQRPIDLLRKALKNGSSSELSSTVLNVLQNSYRYR